VQTFIVFMPVSASGRVLKVLVDNGRSSRRWLRVNVKLSHDALLAAHSAPNSLKASEVNRPGFAGGYLV
jgi:hypothetical protein